MFNDFYPFIAIGRSINNPFLDDEHFLKTIYFKFSTCIREYLVEVKCYGCSLYIVEFYIRTDKNNKKYARYGKLTNDNNATKIIRTCFEIMLSILKDDENASFAFIGTPSFRNNQQTESIECTKRFRIYRYVSINLLGETSFEQFGDVYTSCYLIANNKGNKQEIKELASTVLMSLF